MPISLILTPFDPFQNMSSGGIGPDLILTLCLRSPFWMERDNNQEAVNALYLLNMQRVPNN